MSKRRRTTRQMRPAARVTAPIAEKANPAFAGITMFNDVPQPHTMPRNYKNYANEGYAANDSVFKCVNYIVTNGAAIPPKLYTDTTREKEITSHPLLDRLARPNPEQDGVTFREAVLGWYHIAGNAFLYAIRGGKPGSTTGAPNELWVLEPNKVKPLPTATRGITGYQFEDFDSSQNPIPPENIGHLRTWNPKDPIFGLSPIEVAALMIDQQNAARKWNLALMQNMGKPSGAWVTDAAIGKNERDQLEVKINEKLAGARNAGRVPVIDAGAKWVPSSLPPSELDWLKSMQYNAGQIANLFNIPPQLIGDTSATTYNNMEQAKAASYTEAIFPALDKLYSLLTMWLVPMYPDLTDGNGQPHAYLYYDKDSVEVIQAVIQAQKMAEADRAVKAYMAGAITLNQAQEMQGLPDLGAKGDVYRIGLVLIPADKLDVYAEQSLTEPAKPPKPVPEPVADQPPPPGAPTAPPDSSPPVDDSPEPPEPPPPAPPPGAPTPTNGDSTKAWVRAAAEQKKRTLRLRKARAADPSSVTHILWECQPTACDFCLQNDGVMVEAGDAFPNGCYLPDDCHRFCECSAYEVAIPSDMSDDALTAMGTAGLAALYAVGYIPSHHARDVAQAAQASGAATGASLLGNGDEDEEDQTGATYAAPTSTPSKPKPKPKPVPVATRKPTREEPKTPDAETTPTSERRKSREVFQQFREVTVG